MESAWCTLLIFTRILGGKDVNITDAPFQVSYADRCGAVLIHRKWALTTAHCGPEGTFIRIGSRHRLKGPKAQVLSHLIHPNYQQDHEFDYDVQLLKLFKQLHFSELVGDVKICGGDCGDMVWVFGWGYPKEKGDFADTLQAVKMEIVRLHKCQKVKESLFNYTLTSRMLCAGGPGKDACQGDSGGAALASGQLIGLSSFGHGCGRNLPGVYTNLRNPDIRGWITRLTDV